MQSMRVSSKPWRFMSNMVSRRIANSDWDEGTVKSTKFRQYSLQADTLVNRFQLSVRGGNGGSGCTNFRTSGHSRDSFADGGDGGNGGNVVLECSAALWDFNNLQHVVNGYGGGQGHSKKRVGSRGADKIVQVPVGTVIYVEKGIIPSVEQSTVLTDTAAWIDEGEIKLEERKFSTTSSVKQLQVGCGTSSTESTHTEKAGILIQEKLRIKNLATEARNFADNKMTVLDTAGHHLLEYDSGRISASEDEYDDGHLPNLEDNFNGGALKPLTAHNVVELVSPGECLLVASGGKGGRGNAAKARACGRKGEISNLEHEPGQPGSEAILILELKAIIDVGLVGLQSTAKSHLLGAISRAKTKVGLNPLTILRPNIGRVVFGDYFALTVADISGLLECEHECDEIGIAFLKSIKHTKTLAYVLDLASFLGEKEGLPPWDQLEQLKFKLEKYQTGLSHRPSLVVANKIDQAGAQEVLTELRRRLPSVKIFPVCAVMEEGINSLKWGLRLLVEDSIIHAPSL